MAKLIVNVPAFNREAIKKDMFIQVKSASDVNNQKIINGVISKVEDTKITYITSNGVTLAVHVHHVVEGKTIINVAHGWDEPSGVNHLIKDARVSRDVLNGHVIKAQLSVYTNPDNHSVAGILFDSVFVDGIQYTQAPKFTRYSVTKDADN